MSSITIDGKTFSGNSVSIVDGKVTIDGVVQDGTLEGVVELHITGTLGSLRTDGSVHMKGNVEGDVDAGGNVNCGDVKGDVDAGGNVNCGDVKGDVDAGGNVNYR